MQPVPGLGPEDATKEDVEGFYDFWYNFDSWRSFEWMDKEVNEGSDRYVADGNIIYCPHFSPFEKSRRQAIYREEKQVGTCTQKEGGHCQNSLFGRSDTEVDLICLIFTVG